MRNFGVLKTIVVLQAVCMIVLSVVVVVKLSPIVTPDSDGETKAHSGSDAGNEGNTSDGQGNIAATVGGYPILMGELEQKLYSQYGESVLRTMMVRKAIDLEAEAQQLDVSAEEQERELAAIIAGYDDEEAFYQVMEEQLGMSRDEVLEDLKYKLLLEKIAILPVALTEADVEQYISEHSEQFSSRLQLHLQWIVTNTNSRAEDVLDRLAAGDDFTELAKTYSTDEFTAELGGDLGLIDSDDPFYDADMMDTASRLQTGEMAGPLKVDEGYAIIRVTERQKTSGLTGRFLYDAARKQLALTRAKPLEEIEDQLLLKYGAVKEM